MPISMRCPGCQTRFDFADDLDGKRIKCKSCGDIFRVTNPAPARKGRDEDGDDRPVSRARRPINDDEDDRPSRSRRREDDSDDDLPRRRRDNDEDERPRKKKSSLLLIVLPLAFVGLVGITIVGYIVFHNSKKKGGFGGDSADMVVAPSRSCPLEVPEKDVGTLLMADNGNTFGLLRKSPFPQNAWTFEPYDLAAKKPLGKIDLTRLQDPKAYTLSPDGKYLLLTEVPGAGWAGDGHLSLWSLADKKKVNANQWFPYQKDDKRGFDAPALFRSEFIANDRIVTVGTDRSFFIWQFPSFEVQIGSVPAVEKDGLGKRSNIPHDHAHRGQWEVAWTADRKRMAVWTGDQYVIVNTADGVETCRTTSARQLAKGIWGNTSGDPNRVKGGPVAFSPDGSTLAAIIQSDFGNKRELCLWNAVETRDIISAHPIAENQWNDATSIHWWGNKFIATHGGRIDGMLIDVKSGEARRQLMGPFNRKYGFTRNGKLWYAASEERTKPAILHIVDGLDPEKLTGPEDYEQIVELKDTFLRRLWLEPTGILREPTRDDPPIKRDLIRRP